MHQQEMALKAYQEYLDYSGEDPLMTFEEWLDEQAELESDYLEERWEEMQEEDFLRRNAKKFDRKRYFT